MYNVFYKFLNTNLHKAFYLVYNKYRLVVSIKYKGSWNCSQLFIF